MKSYRSIRVSVCILTLILNGLQSAQSNMIYVSGGASPNGDGSN